MATNKEHQVSEFAQPRFIISAVILLALIAAFVWLILMNSTEEQEEPTSGTPATATQPQSGQSGLNQSGQDTAISVDADASICGLTSTDDNIPTSPPPTTPLSVGERLTVPSLNGYGPGITDGITHCYAHNPTGAILAAANFLTWFSSQQQLPDVAQALFENSETAQTLIADIAGSWDGSTNSALDIKGFFYEDRGPDHALVVLAVSDITYPDELVAFPLPMVWDEGDWKIQPPANMSWGESFIYSLEAEGFIPWEP